MKEVSNALDEIARQVVDAAFEVRRRTGPGLLEKAYERCLAVELEARGLAVDQQVPVSFRYRDADVEQALRIDLLVEHQVVVEVKSVAALQRVHEAQLLTYLRLAGYRLGFLINFSEPRLTDGIRRRIMRHPH